MQLFHSNEFFFLFFHAFRWSTTNKTILLHYSYRKDSLSVWRESIMNLIYSTMDFLKRLFRRPTNRQIEPVDTALLNYLDGLQNIQPEPGDTHEILLDKASRLIKNHCEFYGYNIPPPHTSLDLARHLESLNATTPAGLVLLVQRGSAIFLKAIVHSAYSIYT
jgi:hypothetical protein